MCESLQRARGGMALWRVGWLGPRGLPRGGCRHRPELSRAIYTRDDNIVLLILGLSGLVYPLKLE